MTQLPWPDKWSSIDAPQNPHKATSEGFAGAPAMDISGETASSSLTAPTVLAEITALKQRGRPFLPGESGNPCGRPKGAKNKLTDLFLSAITEDFAKHGVEALARVRAQDPASYLKIISSFIPRELVLQREESPAVDYADLTHDELVELHRSSQKAEIR